MSETLTTLIAKAQASLLDDGTRFSTATLTAAFRMALTDYNNHAPIHAADLLAVVSNTSHYEASGGEFLRMLDIFDVLKYDEDGDDHEPLEFVHYVEDNRHFFHLQDEQSSGYLLVRFRQQHTLSGLDSAIETTLTDYQAHILTDGACAYACRIRAAGIAEDNLLNPDAVKGLERSANLFGDAFLRGITTITPQPPSTNRSTSWQDATLKRISSSQVKAVKDI